VIEHIIIEFVKHLEDIEQRVPDSLRLALILCAVGPMFVAAGSFIRIPAEFGTEPDAPLFLGLFIGGLSIILGVFIFLRRAVWKLQDRRRPRIVSLNLK
jgi:uncharacterized membrane protein YczE